MSSRLMYAITFSCRGFTAFFHLIFGQDQVSENRAVFE